MDVFRTVSWSDTSGVTMAHVLHHHHPICALLPRSTDTPTRPDRLRTPCRPRTSSHSYSHSSRNITFGVYSAELPYRSVCHGSKCRMVYCRSDNQYRVPCEEHASSQSVGCVVGSLEYGSRSCAISTATMGYMAYQSIFLSFLQGHIVDIA